MQNVYQDWQAEVGSDYRNFARPQFVGGTSKSTINIELLTNRWLQLKRLLFITSTISSSKAIHKKIYEVTNSICLASM